MGDGQGCEVPVCTGTTRESASGVELQVGDSFGSIWFYLLLAARLEMRPPWPHLALRSLVRTVPGWPRGGLGWPRQEWPGVAKLLIQSHSVSFPIPRTLTLALSQKERGFPAFAGDDVCEQCSNQRGNGVMGSCRWFGGWTYLWGGVRLGPFANGPYIQTGGREPRSIRGCEVPAYAGTTKTNVAVRGAMA